MLKNKLNYNLVNIALICLIVYLMYISKNLWLLVFKTIYNIFLPFLFAFFIAYILYPFLNFLIKKKLPKSLGIIIIISIIIGIFVLLSILIFPALFNEIILFVNYIITFINELSNKYNINFSDFEKYLYEIIKNLGLYISNSTLNILNDSISYLVKTFIISSLSIYFLNDMDKIRKNIKNLFLKNYRSSDCIKAIDNELNKYFIAYLKIMIITFFEYTIIYTIIGHPNALILGILSSILGIIPYIGGIITNLIAGITAFTISSSLFIKTIISFFILSIIDGYVINPLVYGKSNQIHPLIIIFAVLTGNLLGGILGSIISLPLTIIISTLIKFYKNDIYFIKNNIKKYKI